MRESSKYILSTIILVLFLAIQSFAQVGQYSYKLDEAKSLDLVIDDLSKTYGLQFSYPSDIIKIYTVNRSDNIFDNLSDLLNKILINTDLEFQINESRKILLRPKRRITLSENKSNTINKFKIFGTVLNEKGEPLSFVDVILDTLSLGNSTNDQGYFEFEIPNNLINRNISFHLVGHSTFSKSIKENQSQPKTKLSSSVFNIEEIVLIDKVLSITPKPESLSQTIQADYLNSIISAPIISSDITRSLQMVAGVDATNDLDASIRIRGSQDDETLIVLDGIPIYKAEHFYGIFGSVNGNHVNSVSLHKNSLPLQFGGKTGGLVEMNSKNYFNKASAGIDVNMLTSSITFSAPINKKLSFIASGRTSYDNAADSKIFNWIEPSPEENIINNELEGRPLTLNTFPNMTFFDLNGKLLFRPNEKHLFSLSAFKSQDDFNNAYDITYSNPQVQGRVNAQEEFNDQEDWRNFGFSLQHTGNFNNWKINSRFYNSRFDYSGSLNASLRIERTILDEAFSLTNQKENQINDWGFHSVAFKNIGSNTLSFGLSGTHHDVLFNFDADNTRRVNSDGTGYEGALFAAYDWAASDGWMINIGGRTDYYSETDQLYFAPRISSFYNLSDKVTLKGSFAKHYQFLREVTFYARLREPIDIFLLTSDGKSNKTYPVGSSVNSMVGMTFQKNNWILDFEMYNKNMDGVINHTEEIVGINPDNNKPISRNNKAIIGSGRSFGTDISIGYQDKHLTSWLAYTLSKTTNQFPELFRNEAIPSENDRRHQVKLTNQLDLGNWSINGSYVFASGLSQLNLFDNDSEINLREILSSQAFSRLDPYHRVDLGVTYNFEFHRQKFAIGLSVFNLTNNQNVDYIQYLFRVPTTKNNSNRNVLSGTTTQLLDRTFNLTFKAEF